MTLNGNGTVIFDNANTYTGGTYVNAGLLKVTAANNGLLAGSNVTNNAGLEFDGAQTLGTISAIAGTGRRTTTVGSAGNLSVASLAQAEPGQQRPDHHHRQRQQHGGQPHRQRQPGGGPGRFHHLAEDHRQRHAPARAA